MTSDIRVQVGRAAKRWARPHRVILGRRHPVETRVGESFMPLSDLPTMSARWFSVQDVDIRSAVDDGNSAQVMVRCDSEHNGVQVWDGREPVRLTPGSVYVPQGSTIFVGDLVQGRICGARIDLSPLPPATAQPRPNGSRTEPPPRLSLPDETHGVVLARYHRYYRHPRHFDPQPVSWADAAVVLGLLDGSQVRDERAVRRAVTKPQDAITRLKHEIDRLHPGWLPAASETQKSFHDHLRAVLEMYGAFDPHVLIGFDEQYPRALTRGSTAAF